MHDEGPAQSVHVLRSNVGVVPVCSSVRRFELVREAPPGLDRTLRDVGRPVHEGAAHLVDAVPVKASRLTVQVVRDVDDDLVPDADLEARAGPSAIDT